MKTKSKITSSAVIVISAAIFVFGCGKTQTGENNDKQQTQSSQNMMQNTQDQKTTDTKNSSMQNMDNSNMENMDNSSKGGNKEHVTINVSSMQCGTCKKNIEKAVNKVDGVIDVNVDKDKKVAHVNFDKSKTSLSKLENAITAAGYDANDKKADPTAYNNLDDCCKLPKDKK